MSKSKTNIEEEIPWNVLTLKDDESGQEYQIKYRSLLGRTNYLSHLTQSSIPMKVVKTLDGEIKLVPLVGYIK